MRLCDKRPTADPRAIWESGAPRRVACPGKFPMRLEFQGTLVRALARDPS